ncbi:flagellar basal body-associated protein FliL [Actimicrobium antarcticum]|uniref:Flagellar protein FliL n=1 Tax=Actimicrobium antarcticum TaxID=1051899 RepID=A0ABP7SRD6_9BURK
MATAPKSAPKAEAADGAPTGKKKSKMKLIIIAVIVLLIAGGGAAFFLMGKKDEHGAKEVKHEAAKAPVFFTMDPFTVNLQQEGGDQYLQIAMTVQVADAKQVEEIKVYMPQVRSRVLLLLSAKKASEINTAEGKKLLAKEIVAQISMPFSTGGKPQEVNDVFFTSFVIQ